VFENERGFLHAFSADGMADRTSPPSLGSEWRILKSRLNIKRYPVCYAMHRAVDALLDLKQTSGFAAEEVERIEARIGSTQAAMLRVDVPSTPLEAKFSAKFCLAAAATAGQLGLEQITEEWVARADVLDLAGRTAIVTTGETDPSFPNYSPFDQVSVHLRDGRKLESEPVRRARGHADAPLSPAELRDKFTDCVGRHLSPAQRDRLFTALQNLSALPQASELSAIATMRPQGPRPANQNKLIAMGGDRS
jgi:2-methylcitrate dehydratase PrpD